jgi:hypothetical protein
MTTYALAHLCVAGFCVWMAILNVRPRLDIWSGTIQGVPALQPGPQLPDRPPRPIPPYVSPLPPRPPIGNDPLFWKELHLEQEKTHDAIRALVALAAILLLIGTGMICLTAMMDAVSRGRPLGTVTNPMARFIGSAMGSLTLLGIVFTAVGTVSREREQQTLDSLLTLPIEREEILWAKWLGSIASVRRLFWGLLGVWLFALITFGLHPLALPLLGLAWLAHAAFAASLGLWFSVTSPSKVQATLRALLTLFAIMAASILLSDKLAWTTPMVSFWALGLHPRERFLSPAAPDGPETHPDQLLLALVGAAGYALAALGLWWWSCYRFRKEMGPQPQRGGSQ